MQQKINNWHLSSLVIIVSIISISLVQQYALAQWNDPIGLPGETNGFRLVVNPMQEDLMLNGYDLIDDNLRIDANGDNTLQILNNKNLCLSGDCRNAWPTGAGGGLWSENAPNIYYNTGNVGIGTQDPSSALELYSDQVDGANLKLQNSLGDMKIIFQEYNPPLTPYGDVSIRYNGNNPTINAGYANWLEFWGRDPSQGGGRPIMTMQRDYIPAASNYRGVGIGVPAASNINAKLRVQNYGTEDILQLYDNNTLKFQVTDGGRVGINGPNTHVDVPLFINGSSGAGLKLYPNKVYAHGDNLELYSSGNIFTYNWVGIGTNNPNKQLHIVSPSGQNAEVDIQSAANNHWGIYQEETNGSLNFWNIDNRLTLAQNGNVGIGTTNPTAKLEVAGNMELSGNIYKSGTTNFFGAACAVGTHVASINSNGTLNCTADTGSGGGVPLTETQVQDYIFDSDPATVLGVWTYAARPVFNGGLSGSSAPFSVDSNYLVSNLNADLLDGRQATAFQDDIGADCTTNNYVYGVNDNGTLKCRADQTGSTSLWTASGANIYRSSGNVGIGDTTPLSALTVGNGDVFQVNASGDMVKIKNIAYSWPSSQGTADTYLKNNGSGGLTWATVAAGAGDNLGNHIATQNINTNNNWISNDGTDKGIYIVANGEVITLGDRASDTLYTNGSLNIDRNTSNVAIKVANAEALWYSGTRFSWGYGGDSNFFSDRIGVGVQPDDASLILSVLGDTKLDGNVGIGISPATAPLDVNGQIKIRGGSPRAGKVLTSDANGLASWEYRRQGSFGAGVVRAQSAVPFGTSGFTASSVTLYGVGNDGYSGQPAVFLSGGATAEAICLALGGRLMSFTSSIFSGTGYFGDPRAYWSTISDKWVVDNSLPGPGYSFNLIDSVNCLDIVY